MKTAVDEVTQAYKTFNKAIDYVLKEKPGPDRWQAAYKFWLSLSPRNEILANDVAKENAMYAKANSDVGNTYGKAKNSSLHTFMTFPAGFYYVLTKVDPFVMSDKTNDKKLRKTFPQFCRSEGHF